VYEVARRKPRDVVDLRVRRGEQHLSLRIRLDAGLDAGPAAGLASARTGG
jgi:hypothetical protein